ncbi:tRNA pseudouridine(55) synthase TruB [Helicobacter didelphidarum]|uniref:tRNA pseudouridine(55) synthase n=2 Tax=Helicobacter didelphidarum TaxID=2040648 RepID=A0A3D8ILW1_9HELI|nr:tRNA pseudouridine(55) synthase TruB [Helicobacter didelphidarum]
MSSLNFTNAIKSALKKQGFQITKIGFSGTLDPFARGQLILGVNSYTKLLRHIQKDYKTYRATLHLGLESASLDTENIIDIKEVRKVKLEEIEQILESLHGTISYTPPKFSAKHINGKRAYELARTQINFELPIITMEVYSLNLLAYNHPFLSFEVCVSEGGYVRSIGELIAKGLGVKGGLCDLERISEGSLNYHDMLINIEHNRIQHNFQNKPFNRKDSHKINILSLQEKYQTQSMQHNITLLRPNTILELDFLYKNKAQKTKLIVIDMQNTLKYDTISLLKYAKESFNGAKITLDSQICSYLFEKPLRRKDKEQIKGESHTKENEKDSQDILRKYSNLHDTRTFLADFGGHFSILEIARNGKVKYILNRIDKC